MLDDSETSEGSSYLGTGSRGGRGRLLTPLEFAPAVPTLPKVPSVSGADGRSCFDLAGKQITCACSTDHCRAQNTNRCNTTYICYTQYLYKPDGSDPFTRGCIHSKTPLLCENRRPAIHSAAEWPLLACCSHNLCNQDALPLPPGMFVLLR